MRIPNGRISVLLSRRASYDNIAYRRLYRAGIEVRSGLWMGGKPNRRMANAIIDPNPFDWDPAPGVPKHCATVYQRRGEKVVVLFGRDFEEIHFI